MFGDQKHNHWWRRVTRRNHSLSCFSLFFLFFHLIIYPLCTLLSKTTTGAKIDFNNRKYTSEAGTYCCYYTVVFCNIQRTVCKLIGDSLKYRRGWKDYVVLKNITRVENSPGDYFAQNEFTTDDSRGGKKKENSDLSLSITHSL